MKITIEEKGKDPQVFEGINVFQLIAQNKEKTMSICHAEKEEDITIFHMITFGQAVDAVYKKHKPWIDLFKTIEPDLPDNEIKTEKSGYVHAGDTDDTPVPEAKESKIIAFPDLREKTEE